MNIFHVRWGNKINRIDKTLSRSGKRLRVHICIQVYRHIYRDKITKELISVGLRTSAPRMATTRSASRMASIQAGLFHRPRDFSPNSQPSKLDLLLTQVNAPRRHQELDHWYQILARCIHPTIHRQIAPPDKQPFQVKTRPTLQFISKRHWLKRGRGGRKQQKELLRQANDP